MKIQPLFYTTASGNTIHIREAKASDAESLIHCIQSYLKNNSIPLTEEEFRPTIDEQVNWVNTFIHNKNDLLLIAECNGYIIGNIDLKMQHRKMLAHTGIIGMGIHPDWQGQGIGTVLIERIIAWADTNVAVEILWLQVFSTNERAIKFYAKMGFHEEGRQRRFIKNIHGEYIDNVIMVRS